MMIKARDLQPGQVIRVEYGDDGNWQKFFVEKVQPFKNMVSVFVNNVDCNAIKADFAYRLNEEVEVVMQE